MFTMVLEDSENVSSILSGQPAVQEKEIWKNPVLGRAPQIGPLRSQMKVKTGTREGCLEVSCFCVNVAKKDSAGSIFSDFQERKPSRIWGKTGSALSITGWGGRGCFHGCWGGFERGWKFSIRALDVAGKLCRRAQKKHPDDTSWSHNLGYVSQCFVPSKIASCSILQLTKKTRRFHFVHWLLIQGFLPQESEWWSPENAWAPKMHHHLFGQYRVPKKTEQFFQDVLDDMIISMNFQGSNFSTYSGVAIHKSLVIYLGLSGSVPLTLLLNYNISSWYSPFFVA